MMNFSLGNRFFQFSVLTCLLLSTNFVLAEAWNASNSPDKVITAAVGEINRRLEDFPRKAFLTKTPWPDTYWPHFKLGISHRFNDNPNRPVSAVRVNRWGRNFYVYSGFTKEELQNMTLEQLRMLSPAEKIDIANGDYTYPTYNYERNNHSTRTAAWMGRCHAWSPEALENEEPGYYEYTNADGITIPFTSSDIKGALIWNRDVNNQAKAVFAGTRSGGRIHSGDLNAGSFLMILGNLIGLNNTGFVGDVDPGYEVWNQPFYGYEIHSVKTYNRSSRYSAPGTTTEVEMKVDAYYINELDGPKAEPQLNGPRHKLAEDPKDYTKGFLVKRSFNMVAELNSHGEIIGGRYVGYNQNLDMIWVQPPSTYEGKFAILPHILEESLKNK